MRVSSGIGSVAGEGSGANVAGEKLKVWSGVGKPAEAALPERAEARAAAGVGVSRATVRLGCSAEVAVAAPGEVEPATSRGACGRGRGCACGSARRVTVPCSEKSRSCAGPTASSVDGGGGAMTVDAEGVVPDSWASAGAARPVASATAAGITRNLALMVTRSTGSEAPRAWPRRLNRSCRPIAATSSTCWMNRSRLATKMSQNATL